MHGSRHAPDPPVHAPPPAASQSAFGTRRRPCYRRPDRGLPAGLRAAGYAAVGALHEDARRAGAVGDLLGRHLVHKPACVKDLPRAGGQAVDRFRKTAYAAQVPRPAKLVERGADGLLAIQGLLLGDGLAALADEWGAEPRIGASVRRSGSSCTLIHDPYDKGPAARKRQGLCCMQNMG